MKKIVNFLSSLYDKTKKNLVAFYLTVSNKVKYLVDSFSNKKIKEELNIIKNDIQQELEDVKDLVDETKGKVHEVKTVVSDINDKISDGEFTVSEIIEETVKVGETAEDLSKYFDEVRGKIDETIETVYVIKNSPAITTTIVNQDNTISVTPIDTTSENDSVKDKPKLRKGKKK
jgi:gas vesicle protein